MDRRSIFRSKSIGFSISFDFKLNQAMWQYESIGCIHLFILVMLF